MAPTRASDARCGQLFPESIPLPAADTFELGLVLGGTVSAGAYTAGALDFLLEALEAWHANGPLHKVVIKTVAGTSGGAVCAAILGLLSGHKVPHVKRDDTPAGNEDNPTPTANPLWDLWVNEFRIRRLLQIDDLGQDADKDSGVVGNPVQHVPALLNCNMIDEAGGKLAAFGDTPTVTLPYFARPFRLAVTLANLRGIPYRPLGIPAIQDFAGAAYVAHDDFAWFAVPNGAKPEDDPTGIGQREDEFWIKPGSSAPGHVGYGTLVAYATSSGAMPVGLKARALVRPPEHYLYRPWVEAQPNGYKVTWPTPYWDAIPMPTDGVYGFTSADGGTFNNDPVSLVHTALAGLVGTNPRNGAEAKRAMLMIDPLADKPAALGPVGTSLVSVVKNIIPTFIAESRYRTADMALFAEDDVYSRFQLVPFRPKAENKVGEAALAGTALFAAAGWCSRFYRVHDFLLGRQNMQAYLASVLILPANNTLFDNWNDNTRADFASDKDGNRVDIAGKQRKDYFLPILPDRTGNGPIPAPDWPKDKYDPNTLTPMLRTRLKAVVERIAKDNLTGPLPWLLDLFVVPGVVDKLVDSIVRDFKSDLHAAGLRSSAT